MRSILFKLRKLVGFKQKSSSQESRRSNESLEKTCPLSFTNKIQKNIKILKKIFSNSSDVVFREFYFGGNEHLEGCLVFIDNMVDKANLQEDILTPLMFKFNLDSLSPQQISQTAVKIISKNAVSMGQIKEEKEIEKVINGILAGHVALLVNFIDNVIMINNQGWKVRSISEPENERIVRGPREGFVESLGINISLIRKKIIDINLTIEQLQLGKRSKTKLALVYLKDLASPTVLKELRKRINRLEVDNFNAIGELEQMIEDHPWSFFPQIQSTERPDKVVSNIIDGRITVLMEGTPFALIVPAIFTQFMQATDDYAERTLISSFIRLLRYLAFIVSAILPAVYIALISFHPELIPYELSLSISQARASVPFPSFLEALFMILILQLLEEAGLRLPGPIGQTIGIVGGIVIGQGIVQAKLVSPIMVIVVAITAVSSFTVPNYSLSGGLRVMRIFLMICASLLGAVGLALGMTFIIVQFVSMESFGVPYLSPLSPTRYIDLKDTIVRAPIGILKKKKLISIPHQTFSIRHSVSDKKGNKKNEQ